VFDWTKGTREGKGEKIVYKEPGFHFKPPPSGGDNGERSGVVPLESGWGVGLAPGYVGVRYLGVPCNRAGFYARSCQVLGVTKRQTLGRRAQFKS
jgi:hypothetical protein